MSLTPNFTLQILGSLKVNGIRTPGIAMVSAPERGQEWQNSQGFAMSGPVTRYAGNKVTTGNVKFLLTDEQKVEWMARINPILKPVAPKQRPTKIDIVHPYFASAEVRDVGTVKLAGPVWDVETEKGMWVVNWEWQAFHPPKPLPSRVIDPLRPFEGAEPGESKIETATRKLVAENTEAKKFLGDTP